MVKGNLISWVLVLLTAVACGTTPTPAPATAAVPTTQPATATPTSAVATETGAPPVVATTAAPAAATQVSTASPSATLAEATATATTVISPTETDITSTTVITLAAGEVVKLSGDSYTTSDTYRFSADTTLDITWNYTGTASFALWLVNVSENLTDPQYDRILVNDVSGPHAGSASTKIIAGDWTVQVEQAEGPWTVEFKPES